MVTAMAPSTFQRATLAARLRPRHLRIFSSISGGGGDARRQLVLYSKPGCCLCDGLKEKLSVAFSLGGSHSLHSVDLQVRDITVNPEWEQKYQYEIPVLAKVLPDGTEKNLRMSDASKTEFISGFDAPRGRGRGRSDRVRGKGRATRAREFNPYA